MAISQKQYQKIGMFGAVAGLVTPLLLQWVIMPILNFLGQYVPAISLKLANPGTISVNVRESLTGLNGGLAGWLVDAFGLTFTVPFQTYIMSALGGALLFVVGAMAADMLGFLKGNSVAKTRATIFLGNALAAVIIGWSAMSFPSLNIEFVNVLIAFAVNAAFLAYVWVWLDKEMKFGLIPF